MDARVSTIPIPPKAFLDLPHSRLELYPHFQRHHVNLISTFFKCDERLLNNKCFNSPNVLQNLSAFKAMRTSLRINNSINVTRVQDSSTTCWL